MMRSAIRLILMCSLIVAAAGIVSGQARTRAPRPPAPAKAATPTAADLLGKLEGNLYKNSYFGFRVEVPEGYTILNNAEVEIYEAAGTDALAGESARSKKLLEEAAARTRQLLVVSKLKPGELGNAAIEISIARQAPGITADMVLAESVRVATLGGKARLIAMERESFGGRLFSGAKLETNMAGQILTQKMFFAMVRGYALTIGMTFTEPQTLTAFDGMMETLAWTRK